MSPARARFEHEKVIKKRVQWPGKERENKKGNCNISIPPFTEKPRGELDGLFNRMTRTFDTSVDPDDAVTGWG